MLIRLYFRSVRQVEFENRNQILYDDFVLSQVCKNLKFLKNYINGDMNSTHHLSKLS
jgi:hypothetical protein